MYADRTKMMQYYINLSTTPQIPQEGYNPRHYAYKNKKIHLC